MLLLSRSLVDIKAQQLPPAFLVHDALSFASRCSVLDAGLVARRQVSKHRPRASQWWTITNSGTAKPSEARGTLLAKQQDMDTHLRLIRPHQIFFGQEKLG